MLLTNYYERYIDKIIQLPIHASSSKEGLLHSELLLQRDGKLDMYYAPHNEYMNEAASIMLVGITPGFTQMKVALAEAKLAVLEGCKPEVVCQRAKQKASYAGTMRSNLITMLNALQLQHYVGIDDCKQLFEQDNEVVHTSSMLRYPVFVNGRNYNGSSPAVISNDFLRELALQHLREEFRWLGQVLVIPLGKAVESILRLLVVEGVLQEQQCLWGFPHPSGANGHRHQQFANEQAQLSERARRILT